MTVEGGKRREFSQVLEIFDNMFFFRISVCEVRQWCVLPIARLHLCALQSFTPGCFNDA